MEMRTDLALESGKRLEEQGKRLPKGLNIRTEHRSGMEANVVEVRSKAASEAVGKPKGTYVTLELGGLLRREKDSFSRGVHAVSEYVTEMMNLPKRLPVLVAGLGNREVTPDAIGPLTADRILVTRHMIRQMPRQFGSFRPVCAISPGVLGTTGMESAEMVRAAVERMGAAAVIAVDAIAARSTTRLCSTLQLSDTGITPGSGIGNSRSALNRETLGVPVIALGVPTVTDAATLAADLMERAGGEADEGALRQVEPGMIVTRGDIDRRIHELTRVLAYGINLALQEQLSLEELMDLQD